MNTNDLLAELAFTYSLDWANDDLPYDFNVKSGRLVSVPYSGEVNDIPAFVIHNLTAREFREMLGEGHFDWSDLSQHPEVPEAQETGQTFRANACLKASYYA